VADLATEHDISAIPKVELHVHLNGSITEATASVLARRHGADPENALRLIDGHCPGHYPNFEGFLDTYLAANEFVRTPDDLELVAFEFARAQAAQNVVYSEAIFTAMIYVRNGMEPKAMWAALRRGLAAAGSSTRVALVVDAIRDFGRPEAGPGPYDGPPGALSRPRGVRPRLRRRASWASWAWEDASVSCRP